MKTLMCAVVFIAMLLAVPAHSTQIEPMAGVALWTNLKAGNHLWLWVLADPSTDPLRAEHTWDLPPTVIYFSDAPDNFRVCATREGTSDCKPLGELRRWLKESQ